MKGLIFNLLDNMASKSGCADEAWDLVMEFVASEAAGEPLSDRCLTASEDGWSAFAFDAPAEAVVQCLGTEGSVRGERLSGYPDIARALDEWTATEGGDDGMGQDLLSLLEQLLADALTDGADRDEEEREPRLTLSPPRGSD